MNALLPAVAAALIERKETLATAESCTGGLLGAVLTSLPGSSAWYLGGVVAYANSLKTRMLNVPDETLAIHGAVSAETARAMAAGARAKTGADWTLALTGIAGPQGGTPAKPVGLVYVALSSVKTTAVFEHRFPGPRPTIRAAATHAALEHLLTAIYRS